METQKPLIIAEKPSAARAIAEALGGFKRAGDYLESGQYLLTWAIGHLVELLDPEEYDPRWKRWSLETLPIAPAEFRLKVARRTQKQFTTIAGLIKKAASLINACDAGREGELIFRYIVAASAGVRRGTPLPTYRLWVSSLTPEAIRQGFAALKPGGEYDRLYQSALCRSRGDWLVGMNATRAFTVRFGELLSVGRVQTPTLALLVRREQEIRAFQPEPYWEVFADFRTAAGATYRGKWFTPEADRLRSAEEAHAVRARVEQAGQGAVAAVDQKEVAEKPPQLFDLTSLQREANRRYGMTAAATLKAAQELYEQKLITYPRTDSRYLTRDLAAQAGRPLNALARVPAYQPLMDGVDMKRIWTGWVVNDAKVTDHHAIIPTGQAVPALAGAAGRIFDLVARRFLANFYPEARFRDTEVVTAVGPDRFRSRGRTVLDPGWQAVEKPAPATRAKPGQARGEEGAETAPEAAAPLPDLQAHAPVTVGSVAVERKETQPPRPYTEASLLGAMEHAGRALDDEALKEAMKGRGLGTPATRAAIIERLKEVGYIAAKGKVLQPTEKGERLVDLAGQVGASILLNAELTGEWEKRIADIQAGAYDPERLQVEMKGLASQVVEQVRGATGLPPAPARRAGAGPAGAAAPRARRGQSAGAAAVAIVRGAQVPQPGELPPVAGMALGACPRCRSRVEQVGRDWRCTGAGCSLRIPTFLLGRVIGPDVAGLLLREGRTGLLDGFVSRRTGKAFKAYLVLKDGEVGFEFPPTPTRGRRGAPRAGRAGGAAADAAGKAPRRGPAKGKGGRAATAED